MASGLDLYKEWSAHALQNETWYRRLAAICATTGSLGGMLELDVRRRYEPTDVQYLSSLDLLFGIPRLVHFVS
jgi:hypothetical protein